MFHTGLIKKVLLKLQSDQIFGLSKSVFLLICICLSPDIVSIGQIQNQLGIVVNRSEPFLENTHLKIHENYVWFSPADLFKVLKPTTPKHLDNPRGFNGRQTRRTGRDDVEQIHKLMYPFKNDIAVPIIPEMEGYAMLALEMLQQQKELKVNYETINKEIMTDDYFNIKQQMLGRLGDALNVPLDADMIANERFSTGHTEDPRDGHEEEE